MNQNSSIKHPTVTLRSGNVMPVLGLGTWQLTEDTAAKVAYALKLGYTLIDTSGDYGTQQGIGEGIRKSECARTDVYITTKVEENDHAYEAAEKNLNELQYEYVDLLLIHRPPQNGVGETLWKDLMRAKQDGLTKDIGVSNYSIDQMEQLSEATGEMPAVNQIEWSPFGYSDEMLQYAQKNDIIIQAYSPLTRAKRLNDERLIDLAEKYKKTSAQMLLRWNIELGTVPLPKASREEHLEENIEIFDFAISNEDLKLLNDLNEYYSSLSSLPYVSSPANT